MQNCSGTVSASDWLNNAGLLWLALEAHRAGLQLFMVGGSVRDRVLGHPSADIDLVCAQDPTPMARKFARAFRGHWFSLDTTRNYSRVILPPPHACGFDFSPLRAPDLRGDLALRDFTINAMAIDLADLASLAGANTSVQPCPDLPIFDPLHGQADLTRKRLQLCSPTVLVDDPLRILKGLRHCATLGFGLSSATRSACTAASSRLTETAPERIRSELAGIFSATRLDHLRYALNELHSCGAAKALNLSPQASDHLEERVSAALEHAWSLLEMSRTESRYLATRLQWNAGDEFNYRSLGLLATWLRAANEPSRELSASKLHLKLSRKGSTWLRGFLSCPQDILTQLEHLNWKRFPRRALQHLAYTRIPLPEGLAALFFFCRHSSDIHALTQLWHAAGACLDKGRIKPLIPAAEMQQYYPLMQGKTLGICLKHLNRAERLGAINSTSDAWKWLKKYACQQNINPEKPQREER